MRCLLPSTPLLAAAVLASAPLASADLIDWGLPQDTTSTAEISTNGTPVAAFNFWNSPTSVDLVINGVTFVAPFTPTEWDSGGGSLMAMNTTGDLDFDQLLATARTTFGTPASNPTGFGAIRLDTLVPLQQGQIYELQIWYCDQRFGLLRDRVMTMSSATGDVTTTGGIADNLGSLNQGSISAGLEADPNNDNDPATDTIYGQFIVGSFTRTSTDPLWLLVEGSHPTAATLRPHVTAMQIRAVDGVSVGAPYCAAAINSTGVAASISGLGTPVASSNDLTLTVSGMPTFSFGFFITSRAQGFVMNPGGSAGNLCLSGAVGRYVGPGQIQNSGSAGSIAIVADLSQQPQPAGFETVTAGDTWNWSAWYRDSDMAGPTSNFSNGLSIVFQ